MVIKALKQSSDYFFVFLTINFAKDNTSYQWEEAEVLFKSGTNFLVESVEKIYDRRLMREITEIILKEK